ncbi:Hypothetical predicted protein [Octopus vulgaris]|uniref:Uncharacterized protein n=1 Tax=Octopus vulgaris TaxID=6645 RepID=A0AA36FCY6_OCTVU|nr:Hypothetical predicted protein [Octopus vulgaris]
MQHRRMRLAGHCIRHTDEIANKLVLWKPIEGRTRRGRRKPTCIDNLLENTGSMNSFHHGYVLVRNFTKFLSSIFPVDIQDEAIEGP